MTVKQLLENLALEVAAGQNGLQREIDGIFTGDVLSMALARAKENDAWITVQGHENAVAVGIMADVSVIILTEGVQPSEEMCQRADQNDLPVLKTSLSSYEMCIELDRLL